MSFTEQQIKAALSAAVDPNTGKDFVAGKAVKNIRIDGDDVSRIVPTIARIRGRFFEETGTFRA